jgi:hypothetical protein
MKVTGTQISRNGKIHWHSEWKRLLTPGVAYYLQLQELMAESEKASRGRWWFGNRFFSSG